jgi:UDP-N-acetylglucosamine 1-carboxyvinyltransferase
MLNGMGASISGIGTNQLCVVGVSEIGGVSHRLGSDLIEAGSVIALAGATQSSIKLVDLEQVDLNPMIAPFRTLGISIETSGSTIIATGEGGRLIQSSFDGGLRRFDDAPWPGFPTDLICQAIATSISASGELLFFSRMYERRLAFSSQLKKFGANVQERGRHELLVYGLGAPERLSPTRVYANDIRSSAALLITALSTSGTSVLQESGQLARGHEDFLNRLQAIGACISHCSEF